MYRRIAIFVALALLAPACTATWTEPSALPPTPGYERSTAQVEEVWDAAIDFLVDTGMEWEFIDNDMRTARFTTLVVRGPIGGARVPRPNPEALEYADCGMRGDGSGAGWGNLWASVAIRVRPSPDGSGLLKVVVPTMWQILPGTVGQLRCVSTGTLEEEIRGGIEERITPVF
jgi:hypothetical protein